MFKRALLAVAVVATLASSNLSAAEAAGSGILTPHSGVLYECTEYPYSYSLSLPPGTTGWSMEVTIRSQDGLEATSDFVYDQPGTSGTSEYQLCPTQGAGTYTMTATVDYHDDNYREGTLTLPAASFAMRLPMTRTTLKATISKNKKKHKKAITLRTTTTDERPNGYYGTDSPNLVIQQKNGSSWRTVPNLDLSPGSDGRGSVRFVWPIKKRAVLRAHTAPRDYDHYTGSDSQSVQIR